MSRQYSDQITVRCAAAAPMDPDGQPPEQFVWRRRRYRVVSILQRWVEVGSWWRAAGSAADEEYELWRVEAAAERRQHQAGQYDLCRHRGTGHWFLVRAFD